MSISDQGLQTWKRLLRNPYGNLETFHRERQGSFGNPLVIEDVDYWRLNQTTRSYRTMSGTSVLEESPQGLLALNEKHNRAPWDTGHEFDTFRAKAFASHKDVFIRDGISNGYYKGPLIPVHLPFGLGSTIDQDLLPVETDLSHASNALRVTIPTKSAANLAQALLELVVDLPRIPFESFKHFTSFKQFARQSADEYLNVAFAWTPLGQDVAKYVKAVLRSSEILEQYRRDSGRQVRRGFDYQPSVTASSQQDEVATELNNAGWSTNGFLNLYERRTDAIGVVTTITEITRLEYFRGAWMYYADEGNTLLDKIHNAATYAKILEGTKLNLEVLWELAPWSWLADWVANIGDIIAINEALASDNLVLRYGYFMTTVKKRIVVNHPGVSFRTFQTGPITHTLEMERKVRQRSTPYGFGLNTDAFSAQQWAILGALGLTKNPRKLMWG